MQTLVLSANPLGHFQLKQLPSMRSLRVLHMANTQRDATNIPPTLDNLNNLEDVDLSRNQLTEVPDALFKLPKLRRLNLSDNQIEVLKCFAGTEYWESLEVLNLSRNRLTALPEFLPKLTKLRKLLVNENQLDFAGIPAGIGKLVRLEVFHAAYNRLELVPEGLCRCVKLKRVKLNDNCLLTLPDSIHFLSDLEELDLRRNADLVMPPKPSEIQRRLATYNIDFSLDHQMKLAGQSPSSSLSSSPAPTATPRDPVARKIQFLRRRKGHAEADSDQQRILQGRQALPNDRVCYQSVARPKTLFLSPRSADWWPGITYSVHKFVCLYLCMYIMYVPLSFAKAKVSNWGK